MMVMDEETRLGFSKDHQGLYRDLTEKSSSPFYKKHYADVFIFAIALAIKEDLAPTTVRNRLANIPFSAIGKRDWILNAVAIAEKKDHKILSDQKEVLDQCEKYASSGISLLYKEVFQKEGDFYKRMESYCRTILKAQ